MLTSNNIEDDLLSRGSFSSRRDDFGLRPNFTKNSSSSRMVEAFYSNKDQIMKTNSPQKEQDQEKELLTGMIGLSLKRKYKESMKDLLVSLQKKDPIMAEIQEAGKRYEEERKVRVSNRIQPVKKQRQFIEFNKLQVTQIPEFNFHKKY